MEEGGGVSDLSVENGYTCCSVRRVLFSVPLNLPEYNEGDSFARDDYGGYKLTIFFLSYIFFCVTEKNVFPS